MEFRERSDGVIWIEGTVVFWLCALAFLLHAELYVLAAGFEIQETTPSIQEAALVILATLLPDQMDLLPSTLLCSISEYQINLKDHRASGRKLQLWLKPCMCFPKRLDLRFTVSVRHPVYTNNNHGIIKLKSL